MMDASSKSTPAASSASTSLESECMRMKNELQALPILLQQNAELEKEILRLVRELDEVTGGVLKRGYMYKWREREISFASKWSLRYFVLQGRSLSYYIDDRDQKPRRTIDLTDCVLKDEGRKKGKYSIFGLYYDPESVLGIKQRAPLLRLSCDAEQEARQWIDMLQSACDANKAHVQDGSGTMEKEEEQVLCCAAAVDVNSLLTKNVSRDTLDRVLSSSNVLQRVKSRQQVSDTEIAFNSTAASAGTTISPIKSENLLQNLTQEPRLERSRTLSQELVQKRKRQQHQKNSFHASNPIHTESVASPLSDDAKPGQNYRGFFNLAVIILVISNFKLILDNLKNYGNKMSDFIPTFDFSKDDIADDFYSVRPEFVLFSWLVSVLMSYFIELAVVRGYLRGKSATLMHVVAGTYNLIFPVLWVTISRSHPGYCMLYLLQSTILWMKLISYAHVNREMRIEEALEIEKKLDSTDDDFYNNSKPMTSFFADMKDLEPPYRHYPANITLKDVLYFSVAPTLCYQLNYPRLKLIRWKYVASLVLRLLLVLGLMLYFVGQHVKPTLDASMGIVRDMNLFELFEHLLKLSIPNTYVWLLSFYLFFHLWLNLLAELTRFGDRKFYGDWWNARSIDKYWRTWNLPVHNWLLRHMYYPL